MTTPHICLTEKCGRPVYGPWISPCGTHPDAGFCLTCGVARWLERFLERHPELKPVEEATP